MVLIKYRLNDSETSQNINKLQQAIYDSRHSDKEIALNSIVLDPVAVPKANNNITEMPAVTNPVTANPTAENNIQVNSQVTATPAPITPVETVTLNTEMLNLGIPTPEPVIETL